jgi:hypothetical protein
MNGTQAAQLWHQVTNELILLITDSTLRATPVFPRGTFLLLRTTCVKPWKGFCGSQQRRRMGTKKPSAAWEGMGKL